MRALLLLETSGTNR